MIRNGLMLLVSLTLLGCGGGVGEPADEAATEPAVLSKALLDHVILAVPNLEAAAEDFERLTGVAPIAGGVHPGLGTANVLVSLSPVTYLEIIGPSHEATGENLGGKLGALAKPQLIGYALSSSDLEGAAKRVGKVGLQPVGPAEGSRAKPDGTVLHWSSLAFAGHDFGAYLPFLINWGDTPHPAATSPGGLTIQSFAVRHPEAAELLRICRELLGADLEISPANVPSLEIVIAFPGGRTVFLGEGPLDFLDE
jgi:hypothetical protein